METNLCIHELRGGEARCNGGAYDGCACGPYTTADKKEIAIRERRVLARQRTELRIKRLRIIITASLTNLARERGITEDEICKALFRTHEGPVFYYP